MARKPLTVAPVARTPAIGVVIAPVDGPALVLEITRPRSLARGRRRMTVVASVAGELIAWTHVTPGDTVGLEHWLRQLMVLGDLPPLAAPHTLAALVAAAWDGEVAA